MPCYPGVERVKQQTGTGADGVGRRVTGASPCT